MFVKKLPSFSKAAIVTTGVAVVALSIILLRNQAFTPWILLLLLFSALVAPRMGIAIPRSNVGISFSDSVVYLSFLLYGPEAAVVMATVEMFANCYYSKQS